MKKWIPAMVTVAITLALFIYSQCSDPNVLWIEPLSEADKEFLTKEIYAHEILQTDYFARVKWASTSAWDTAYYGTINNCTVIRSEAESITAEWLGWGRFEAAGYVFYWHTPFKLYAYRNAEVCQLGEAYEKGWLTKEQIGIIHEKHQEYVVMMPEDLRTEMEEWAKEKEESQGN